MDWYTIAFNYLGAPESIETSDGWWVHQQACTFAEAFARLADNLVTAGALERARRLGVDLWRDSEPGTLWVPNTKGKAAP